MRRRLPTSISRPRRAVMVFLVLAQVTGEFVDPLGQQRDLDLGGAGVARRRDRTCRSARSSSLWSGSYPVFSKKAPCTRTGHGRGKASTRMGPASCPPLPIVCRPPWETGASPSLRSAHSRDHRPADLRGRRRLRQPHRRSRAARPPFVSRILRLRLLRGDHLLRPLRLRPRLQLLPRRCGAPRA